MKHEFLPVTVAEMKARGWDEPDFVYVTGDAYVDHPSFGLAIISRILEKAGYRVVGVYESVAGEEEREAVKRISDIYVERLDALIK